MSGLPERIDLYLSQHRPVLDETLTVETNDPVVEKAASGIKAALSGAFGEAIEVYIGEGDDAGTFLAEVPIAHLKACGLKMAESIVRPRLGTRDKGTVRAVIGSAESLVNAERRVAKPLGEAWKVSVDSFPCHVGAPDSIYFRVQKA